MICVDAVRVFPKTIILQVGSWFYDVCTEFCPLNADCTEVVWHSDNSSVASVNASNGYIYANAVGTTRIYATATDGSGCSDYLTVTVSNSVPVSSVTLNRSSLSLEEGQNASLSATVCPENATNKELNWTSSNNSVATVSNGIVTAVAKGSATITATSTDGSDQCANCLVTVTGDILVTDICIYSSSHSLLEESSMRLRATVCPIDATNKCVTWTSSDPNIATINPDSGIVLAQKEGNVTMFATAQDGSGVVGTYDLTVLPRIYADSMTISPNTATMYMEGQKGFCATIYPENTTSKTVRWHSEYHNIAEVDSVTGCVLAKALGTTKIYATAQDGSNVSAYATVHVVPRPVKDVMIQQDSVTLKKGETTQLSALVFPGVATNRSVTWESSDTDIATVSENGLVTAISDGTATITVETNDGGFTDECTVTVDSREIVTVIKDSHSFYVQFEDGKIWKNIGIDLSNRKDNYTALYPPEFNYDNYPALIKEEQRYLDNVYVKGNGVMEYKTYSVKQIAYLYLLDPLGIEYYMRNHACQDKDIMSGEFLSYKDEVYEAIFGNSERLSGRFYFTIVDGSVRYERYTGYDRMEVYSNAEIIFGSHTIFNWSSFWQSIGEAIFENIPVISHILLGVEMYQALFYSGSIVSAMSGVASEFLDDYAKETNNTVLEKMLGWPNTVFSCFTALADALVGAFELNNLKDMDIYAKIQEQDYRTVFDRYDSELSIQEIISKCTNS